MSARLTRLTFAAYSAVNVSRVARAVVRRGLAPAIVLTLAAAVLAALTTAHAHPIGNFSVNHLSTVRTSDDRIDVRYILDQAEIPTIQGAQPRSSRASAPRSGRRCAETPVVSRLSR